MQVILATCLLTSCEVLNKKSANKARESKRKIASIQANQDYSKSQIPISNGPVSGLVLFQDNKPVCALSAVEYPQLVPKQLSIARQNNISFKLPKCNRQSVNLIQGIKQRAVFLDKDGGYQSAGAPVAIGVACMVGGALGTALGIYMNQNSGSNPWGAWFTILGSLGGTVISALVIPAHGVSKIGMVGACASTSSLVAYITTGLGERKRRNERR